MIGALGYAVAAIAWATLVVLLTVAGRGRGPGRWLLAAASVEFAWAAAMLGSLVTWAVPQPLAAGLEALRPLAWSVFLLVLLRERADRSAITGGIVLASVIAVAQSATTIAGADPQWRFGTALGAAVLGLLCVEQVYRNTAETRRWAIKFLCLALSALAAFDLALYANALLFATFELGWWSARGYAHALMVPLVAVTAARTADWRLDIQVSRKVVFHSATLLASGAFLLAVSAIGYGLRLSGGAWGGVAQTLIVFVALVTLVALVASETLRARLRVLVSKHFFAYRYDYRSEWLRLTDLLALPDDQDRDDGGAGRISSRALDGLAAMVESPGGALWMRTEDGSFVCEARAGSVGQRGPIAADDPLLRFMATRGWIIELPEWYAHPDRYGALPLPAWIVSDPDAWLIVPLILQDRPVGLVQLQRPRAPMAIDWEVRDILKAAGRQIAGTLAVRQAVEKLLQARQFDSFNRMSAFVVHDLKNLVAQLSLLLRNAARHRDNPEFQQDMLDTVENVLDRMQGLLLQLRVGTRPIEPPSPVPLAETLDSALAAKKPFRLDLMLAVEDPLAGAAVLAHRDRLERVVGHLVQNAIEATSPGGSVRVAARRDGGRAVVDVSDTGRGMSRSFVETRLFRPFVSTKEHGMGIGAFESREYLREIGGSLTVDSAEGRGTTFTIDLPLADDSRLPAPRAR